MRRRLTVEADGGSRGNPGVAGYGALVRAPEPGAPLAAPAAYSARSQHSGSLKVLHPVPAIWSCWEKVQFSPMSREM